MQIIGFLTSKTYKKDTNRWKLFLFYIKQFPAIGYLLDYWNRKMEIKE